MNGPRTKEEAELAWSAVKRAITLEVNYEAQVWREKELNARVDQAWKLFKAAMDQGELLGPDLSSFKKLGDGL